MDYMTVPEASEKWGITGRAILYQLALGRIPGAVKKGNLWLIPLSAAKPEDRRKYGKGRPKKDIAHERKR